MTPVARASPPPLRSWSGDGAPSTKLRPAAATATSTPRRRARPEAASRRRPSPGEKQPAVGPRRRALTVVHVGQGRGRGGVREALSRTGADQGSSSRAPSARTPTPDARPHSRRYRQWAFDAGRRPRAQRVLGFTGRSPPSPGPPGAALGLGVDRIAQEGKGFRIRTSRLRRSPSCASRRCVVLELRPVSQPTRPAGHPRRPPVQGLLASGREGTRRNAGQASTRRTRAGQACPRNWTVVRTAAGG